MNSSLQIELYRNMFLIRHVERVIEELFNQGIASGTCHLCIGQEACAVGVCSALRANDYITSTHRGHGHYLAKGGSPRRLFAEILGLEEGVCFGRGGSQQLLAPSIGFLGANGITGGGLPIATGLAFASKTLGEDRIAVAFFGEGASNEGMFHEALNLASCLQLPVLFVCENNGYCMSTPFSHVSGSANVAQRGVAYGIPAFSIDGNDVELIYETTCRLLENVRLKKPQLLELLTYRMVGHSRSDKRVYRSREEEKQWEQRCPLRRQRERLPLKIEEIITLETNILEYIKSELTGLIDNEKLPRNIFFSGN